MNSLRASAVTVAVAFLANACASTGSQPATTPPASPTIGAATATAVTAATTPAPSAIRIESVIGSDDITLVVTTPVARGQPARATVTTNPHAFCSIAVTYASGPSTADGLAPKDADGGGFVSWSWTVEPSAPTGSWPIEVSCGTVSGLRAVARQMLVVR